MEEEIYYIHINGEQRGPYEKQYLLSAGLTPDTMVWRPGLEEWVEASSLPELNQLFGSYSQRPNNGYSNPNYGQGYNPGPNPRSYGAPPVNNYDNQGYPSGNAYNNNYANGIRRGSFPPDWTNWLAWAIVATVLGVFGGVIMALPGVIGIVKACEANTMARLGDPRAYSVNSVAKAWTLIGLILIGLIIITVIFLIFALGIGLAAASSY